MEIGNRLRELRESRELSQGDIEKRTGLLRCCISRVENGHTVPAIETLVWVPEILARQFRKFWHGLYPPARSLPG
jgi:transcriptional regulator with XRE-family HTH domain